ncbi:MAG: putative selenate reductase subunit YgfK [Bacteroidales bacterium]|nr:putative selenate reductase subunit YgfK [Bacteroidales bacterium]
MSDKFYPISIKQLLQIILKEYNSNKSIFGIPEELFFNPVIDNNFKVNQFKQSIDSPIGVAAGPHSQMAQNIIGAWLMGARYIELKTIQTLDEIEIAKPCIDMQDEGYNCEWSQELKIKESFNEYLNAWIILHILNHKFGWNTDIGTIFNMSVGYNLDGILKDNVQWFFNKMDDCSSELKEKIAEIKSVYPNIDSIEIPTQISNNITLSTMHGCPANEIEDIAKYLLAEKNLHTYVKLNPTLLGSELLREILNDRLNFKTEVPDVAFVHDLKYLDALKIIRSLQETAKQKNLHFGLKLTNTLESRNNKSVFGYDVDMMYMSGRALHPISIHVAKKLQNEFMGELQLSFSGGVDAFNISDILSCGFKTITVCSDILKPGGYMRFNQYFDALRDDFKAQKANNISEFVKKSGTDNIRVAALNNLNQYAEEVLNSNRYKRNHIKDPDIKTNRDLTYFDCISAPCKDTCATNQDIPDYMYYTSSGQFDKAFEVILRTNPFPSITGMVCDHLCQSKCTRVNYDNSLLIREVKRFISEQDEVKLSPENKNDLNVAIIGAGPSGLSCAYYLALAGFSVEVFEANSKAGGMVQYAIPGFRLTDEAIEKDFKRVSDLGVQIHYNHKVDHVTFQSLKENYNYLFIGAGAQLSTPFHLDGIESKGVLDSLEFLFNAKKDATTGLGKNVVIIGGGNTAMDAARTAYRFVGEEGKVTVVYRRTVNEMPADQGEIKAVLEEGMEIMELAGPEKVLLENGHVKALLCSKMKLKESDSSGRPKPVIIEGSEFEIPCDTIIPAIGQSLNIDFIQEDLLKTNPDSYQTQIDNVFIGGDAMRGAATAIKAIGDGRKAAKQIISLCKKTPNTSLLSFCKQSLRQAQCIAFTKVNSLVFKTSKASSLTLSYQRLEKRAVFVQTLINKAEIDFNIIKPLKGKSFNKKELVLKRAKRQFATDLIELDIKDRKNFKLVSETLNQSAIVKEAERCLQCDEICNICTTVCPNFANYSYEIEPVSYYLQKAIRNKKGEVKIINEGLFEVNQKYQILNIANYCNECGNCNTFCPTNSAPYKEKPKLWLTKQSFDIAEEGFYLENKNSLITTQNGNQVSLTENKNDYLFISKDVDAKLNKSDLSILEINLKTKAVKEVNFTLAAEMSILLEAAKNLVFE